MNPLNGNELSSSSSEWTGILQLHVKFLEALVIKEYEMNKSHKCIHIIHQHAHDLLQKISLNTEPEIERDNGRVELTLLL